MLPRPDRTGPTHAQDGTRRPRAHRVRNQAVLAPVAAADDVAGARGGHGDALRLQESAPIARRDQLGRGLARAVGIVAAQRVALAVGIRPLAVEIDLVGGHHDRDAAVGHSAQRVEQVRGSHRVGREGRERVAVAGADQRLRSQMEDELGPRLAHRGGDRRGVAQIDDLARDRRVEIDEPVERRLVGRQCNPGDLGAEATQPEREPRSLEAGVAGEDDALAAPERAVGRHAGHRSRRGRIVRAALTTASRARAPTATAPRAGFARAACPSAARSRCRRTPSARRRAPGRRAAPAPSSSSPRRCDR